MGEFKSGFETPCIKSNCPHKLFCASGASKNVDAWCVGCGAAKVLDITFTASYGSAIGQTHWDALVQCRYVLVLKDSRRAVCAQYRGEIKRLADSYVALGWELRGDPVPVSPERHVNSYWRIAKNADHTTEGVYTAAFNNINVRLCPDCFAAEAENLIWERRVNV